MPPMAATLSSPVCGGPGPFCYDIIFEVETGHDRIDVLNYHYAAAEEFLARDVDDRMGNSYFILDYVYLAGVERASVCAADFVA